LKYDLFLPTLHNKVSFINFKKKLVALIALLTVNCLCFFIFRDVPQEIFSVRFSFDGTLLATGCNDGVVRVYNGKTGGSVLQTLSPTTEDGGPTQGNEELSVQLPITAMRFRPGGNSRGVLLTCSADATVRHWHVPTAKCLSTIYEGSDQQIFACDYRQDGQMFATGGKDKSVRLYDESRSTSSSSGSSGIGSSAIISNIRGSSSSSSSPSGATPIATFGGGLFAGTSIETLSNHSSSSNSDIGSGGCHSNRIFAVTFHPLEKDIILSGGWDNTIQIWDARISGNGQGAVRSMFGAHLCGDALQVTPDGNYVISGSWRPDDALQIWDFRSGKLISSIPFLRSNTEVTPYLNAVAKVRNVNKPIEASNGEGDQSNTPLLKLIPTPPSIPSRLSSNTSATSPPVLSTSIVPEYEKPDPTLLYSISFSKMVSSSHGEGPKQGQYIFAGGSGVNGGKVFKTLDLLSFSSDIYSTRTGESLSIMKMEQDEQKQILEGTKSNSRHETAAPIQARTCRPLIASISGLSRGAFASDWDGNNGLVIVGGDQPIRVFDVIEASVVHEPVGTGGGIKRRAGGRVGALTTVLTESRGINNTENESSLSGVLSSSSVNSSIPTFGSSDAAILTKEVVQPPLAPIALLASPAITLRPPPAVLIALAASNAIESEEVESALESSTKELTEDDVKTARDAISAATLSQETEMNGALESNTLTAWEVDVDDKPLTLTNDEHLEDQEATFDAGYRKIVNSSGTVIREPPSSIASLSEDPIDVHVRRGSGTVDALRALIEGARVNKANE
jgi:WD40 repeat protein